MGSCCLTQDGQDAEDVPLVLDVTAMLEEKCVWEFTDQHETSLQLCIESELQLQSTFPIDIIALIKSYVDTIDDRSTNSNIKYIRNCYSHFKTHGFIADIYKIKVIFMSNDSEGKTQLLQRWKSSKYVVYNEKNPLAAVESFQKTVENIDIYVENVTSIDDCRGESIRQEYMKTENFFVYCFSVHSVYDPLNYFQRWYKRVIELKNLSKKVATNMDINIDQNVSGVVELGKHFCVILCALQCDLCGYGDDGKNENNQRIITYQQGLAIAKRYNIPYIETSAIINQNIDQLFEIILREYACFQYRRTT